MTNEKMQKYVFAVFYTALEFWEQFHVKYQNNAINTDGLSCQKKPEKENSYFFILKGYKNTAEMKLSNSTWVRGFTCYTCALQTLILIIYLSYCQLF